MEKRIISSYTVEKRANRASKKLFKKAKKGIGKRTISGESLDLYLPQVDAGFESIIADIDVAVSNTRTRKEGLRAETYIQIGNDIQSLRHDVDQLNQAHGDVVKKAKVLNINDDQTNYRPVDTNELEEKYKKLARKTGDE